VSTAFLKSVVGVALVAAVFCCQQDTRAADGCCGNAAPVQVVPRFIPVLPAVISPPVPCCGGLPLLPPAPMTVTSGGLIFDAYGFAVPGMHARYPYYDYRAPYAAPGPPHVYRNVIW
jgi:hypothetical protein